MSTSNGPTPLRSAEKDEPDYVPPPARALPFGFKPPTPDPEPVPETEPDLYEGDYA